jgi:hypothetical protein
MLNYELYGRTLLRLGRRLLTAGKGIISKQSRGRRDTSVQVCRKAAQMNAVEWVKEIRHKNPNSSYNGI